MRGLRRHSSDEIVQGVVVVDFVRLELMLVQSKRPQLLTKQTHEAEIISRNTVCPKLFGTPKMYQNGP